jgi:hypothetical protein
MAFDLPRSPRSLRFTGEVRSLSSSGVDTPTRMKLPSLDDDDDDDDRETLCMDRDALDVALLPDARLAKPHAFAAENTLGPQLPVPGFRSRDDVFRQEQAALYAPKQARVSGPFTLGVWLIASLLLAIVSFFAAPVARDTVHAALHTSASR